MQHSDSGHTCPAGPAVLCCSSVPPHHPLQRGSAAPPAPALQRGSSFRRTTRPRASSPFKLLEIALCQNPEQIVSTQTLESFLLLGFVSDRQRRAKDLNKLECLKNGFPFSHLVSPGEEEAFLPSFAQWRERRMNQSSFRPALFISIEVWVGPRSDLILKYF